MGDYELILTGNQDLLKNHNNSNPENYYYESLVERCNILMDNLELFERIIYGIYNFEDEEKFFGKFYGITPYEFKKNTKFINIDCNSLIIDYKYYKSYALAELKSNLALLNAIAANENNENIISAQNNVNKFLSLRESSRS